MPRSSNCWAPTRPSRPPRRTGSIASPTLGRRTANRRYSRRPRRRWTQDVARTREKQCAEAQDRYKKLIEGRKLYKTGADGERQYLTSEEIDSERLNAKRDVDAVCNGAPPSIPVSPPLRPPLRRLPARLPPARKAAPTRALKSPAPPPRLSAGARSGA